MPSTNLADEERRATPEPPSTPDEPPNDGIHHIFERVKSSQSAQQVNGNLSSPNPPSDGPRHCYKVAIAEGWSQQLNGNGTSVELLKAFFGSGCQQKGITKTYKVNTRRHG